MMPGPVKENVELKLPEAISTCATESNRSALRVSVPPPSTAACAPISPKVAVPPLLGKSGLLVQNDPTFHEPLTGPIHVPLICAEQSAGTETKDAAARIARRR